MRRSRRIWLLALTTAVGLCAASCLSPTLPLPPPAVPDIEPIGQGQYRLSGAIPIPGEMVVLNLRSGLGFSEMTPHDYSFDVLAEPGDELRAHYASGNEVSDYVDFTVPRTLPTVPVPKPDAGIPPAADAGRD